MRTARTLVAAAFVAGMAVSTTVSAMTPVQARTTRADPASARGVLICERDAASRRAFARVYGAAPVFITAREAVALAPSEPVWSTPRCMTEIEHAKLREAATANARVN
ncbi:hypothetical protein [Brevundimonas sp.]|uniref:hypothetical protein n=1 Tax=Brevundimonas sp. TaxID=1871086 RepID=UPI002D6BFCBB|nr:hypothetical protein [Brevundimonas sp.]HYC97280.1 hypothetical protein [Brevundimonas sp.]